MILGGIIDMPIAEFMIQEDSNLKLHLRIYFIS